MFMIIVQMWDDNFSITSSTIQTKLVARPFTIYLYQTIPYTLDTLPYHFTIDGLGLDEYRVP